MNLDIHFQQSLALRYQLRGQCLIDGLFIQHESLEKKDEIKKHRNVGKEKFDWIGKHGRLLAIRRINYKLQ